MGRGFFLFQVGKSSLVNADIPPEFCIENDDQENSLPVIFILNVQSLCWPQ